MADRRAASALRAAARAGAAGPKRLPRGRHKLDPVQVAASQRARLFSAMASVTAAKGYAATTVADLLAAAGVSRETFYEQFRSKLDCFEQAFHDASVLLFAVVAQSAAAGGGAPGDEPPGRGAGLGSPATQASRSQERTRRGEPARRGVGAEAEVGAEGKAGVEEEVGERARRERRVERFEGFLAAYLDALASYPDLARLCLVEVYAAGPDLARRRAEVQERFAVQVEKLLGARDDDARFACQALVAAIGAMTTARLAVGDVDGLRALQRPLVTLVRNALR